MITEIDNTIFSRVQDHYGSVATIHYSDDGKHRVIYKNKDSIKFFEEEYAMFSIEYVEQMVVDWAQGKRELV